MNAQRSDVSRMPVSRRAHALFVLAVVAAMVTLLLVMLVEWPVPWIVVVGIVGCATAGACLGAGVTLLSVRPKAPAD